jgi:hypothetical protein
MSRNYSLSGRVIGVTACVLIACAALLLLPDSDCPIEGRADAVESAARASDAGSREAGRASQGGGDGDLVRVRVAQQGYQLRIVTSTGEGVAGASCCLASEERRVYQSSQLACEQQTDERGLTVFDSALAKKISKSTIVIWKNGFQPGRVDGAVLARLGSVELRLEQAATLAAVIVDVPGSRLPGISIAFSKSALPGRLPEEAGHVSADVRPGANTADCIHIGRSGADGVLVLDGLEPGMYLARVLTPGYTIASGKDGAGFLSVPSSSATLVLTQLFACCGKIEGRDVLSYFSQDVPGLRRDAKLDPAYRRAAHQMRQRFGADLVYVGESVQGREVPSDVTFRCLVDGLGWREVSLALAPVSAIEDVEVLSLGSDGPNLGGLRIELSDNGGEAFEGERLFVFGPCPGIGTTAYPISTGRRYGLPVGEYSVRPPRGAAAIEGELKVEVVEGGESVVRLRYAEARRLCRFRVIDGDGEPVSFANLTLQSGNYLENVSSRNADDIRACLPVGIVDVTFFAAGADPIVEAVRVESSQGRGRQLIELVVRRGR